MPATAFTARAVTTVSRVSWLNSKELFVKKAADGKCDVTTADKMVISVTHGVAGYFAVLRDACPPFEPIQSGNGRYATRDEAVRESVLWSEADHVPLSTKTRERAIELGLLTQSPERQARSVPAASPVVRRTGATDVPEAA
jgi:Arc/MetJ-type ribon-helix-helix transcriptional regulator